MGRAGRPGLGGAPQPVEAFYSPAELQEGRYLAQQLKDIDPSVEIDPLLAAMIPTRDPQEALLWLRGDRSLLPSGEEVCPGMSAAAEDLRYSLQNGEKVALFCDYDVDGVTGGEALRAALLHFGQDPLIGYASPRDGFGMTSECVERAAKEGYKVIVTVDCGSQSLEAIELAKSKGIKVVVTDHHDIRDADQNTADHHLNPGLHEPRTSVATGSQMAWYLGRELFGLEVPESYYEEPLYLAGMGCISDWGPHKPNENRPFLKASHAPQGVRMLAEQKGENPDTLEKLWKTSAALNMAKRTEHIQGEDIARIIRATSEKDFQEAAEKISRVQEELWDMQKQIQKAMEDEHPQGRPDNRIVAFTTDEKGSVGTTGTLAPRLANRRETPAFVFAPMGDGVYKFSGRIPDGYQMPIGKMADDPGVQTLLLSGGGHERVFSGECRQEDIPELVQAMENWAQKQEGFYKQEAKQSKDVHVHERMLSPKRLSAVEQGLHKLAPFHKRDGHIEPKVSLRGRIENVRKDGNRTVGDLRMEDGSTREVEAVCGEGEGEVVLQLRAGGDLPRAEALL